jgi:hypothetical protein
MVTFPASGWYNVTTIGLPSSPTLAAFNGRRIVSDRSIELTQPIFFDGVTPQRIVVQTSTMFHQSANLTVAVNAPVVAQTYANASACPRDADGRVCGHGICVQGMCACDDLYEGFACDMMICRVEECLGSESCRTQQFSDSLVPSCNGRGTCANGRCECAGSPFAEPRLNCTQNGCLGDGTCSGHGSCVANSCVCDAGFEGLDCAINTCGTASAVLPGLALSYFAGLQFLPQTTLSFMPALTLAVPHVHESWGYMTLLPNMEGVYTRSIMVAEGLFLWPGPSASVGFRCTVYAFDCNIFVNGTAMGPVFNVTLARGKHRIKFLVRVRARSSCSARGTGAPMRRAQGVGTAPSVTLDWLPPGATAYSLIPDGHALAQSALVC